MPIGTGVGPSAIFDLPDAIVPLGGTYIDFQQGTLDSRVTYTRAGNASRMNNAGLLEIVGADVPRLNYAAPGVPKGLLLEPASTNLMPVSIDFVNAWVPANCTKWPNSAIAPDGTLTACMLQDVPGIATKSLSRSGVSFVAGTWYTFSFFIKPGTKTLARLTLPASSFSINFSAFFDLAACTVLPTVGGAIANIEYFANGWCICSITALCDVNGAGSASVYPASRYTSIVTGQFTFGAGYPADGTGSIYVWGAQIEALPFRTSFILTNGATASRSAESAIISGANFTGLWNATEDTVVLLAESTPVRSRLTSDIGLLAIDDGTAANRISLTKTAGDLARYQSVAASVAEADISSANQFANNASLQKLAAGIKLNDEVFSFNGIQAGTDGAVSIPAGLNRIVLGDVPGVGTNCGHIAGLRVFNSKLANATVTGLTTL